MTGYTRAQIGIHWVIAILILLNYLMSDGMRQKLDAALQTGGTGTLAGGGWHVWLGLTVLALVVLRLVLRFTQGAPKAGGVPGSLTQRAAGAMHLLLYVLMISVPLGGAIMWFQGIKALGQGHGLAGNLLLILAGLHAVAGLYHHYAVKDGTLLRMMRPR